MKKRLQLRIPSVEDWQRYFDPNIAGGGVFCPHNDPPEVGSQVRVEICFASGPRFFVEGVVMWRRPNLHDPRARAGVGVQVSPQERNKVSYVNAWARGGVVDKREQRRLPVRLRVTYSGKTGRRINFTRDLSEDGIFIRAQELLALDTPIKLLVVPPRDKPLELQGRVARHRDDAEERGMGILLEFRDEEARSEYIRFVHRLEQLFLSGQLPDEAV